jgi:hypothetical protein
VASVVHLSTGAVAVGPPEVKRAELPRNRNRIATAGGSDTRALCLPMTNWRGGSVVALRRQRRTQCPAGEKTKRQEGRSICSGRNHQP